MSKPSSALGAADPWEEYWRRTREAAAHLEGGPQEEALARFWGSLFDDLFASGGQRRVLDVACGNGAVTRHSLEAASRCATPAPRNFATDTSLAALVELTRRHRGVEVVASDARRSPFPDGSFEVVASQFGLEYAGTQAFDEAMRLVAPGGVLAAVVHLAGGAIFRENVACLAAIEALVESKLLGAAKELFRADSALRSGRGSRPALRRAEGAMALALEGSARILHEYGPESAGGVIRKLLADVQHMLQRMPAFAPDDVARWTDLMAAEADAYRGRMSSMLEAAVDARGMEGIARWAGSRGLSIRMRQAVHMGSAPEPAAWLLVAERGR